MREIKYIVIHCTAGPQDQKIDPIKNYWRNSLGWTNPGYHIIIKPSGELEDLLPIEKLANGVTGYNSNSIHISYIGGVDRDNRAIDNRTDEQKETLKSLVNKFILKFPNAKVLGHRDFPGVKKDCPSFDVSEWVKTFNEK